jgi:hypothetical protein
LVGAGRQVAGYSGLLLAAPTVLYEIIAYVVPGLTKSERKFLAPIVFGSSILFYTGWVVAFAGVGPCAERRCLTPLLASFEWLVLVVLGRGWRACAVGFRVYYVLLADCCRS